MNAEHTTMSAMRPWRHWRPSIKCKNISIKCKNILWGERWSEPFHILVDPRGYRIRFEDVSVLNPIDEAHLKRASHTDIGVTA